LARYPPNCLLLSYPLAVLSRDDQLNVVVMEVLPLLVARVSYPEKQQAEQC